MMMMSRLRRGFTSRFKPSHAIITLASAVGVVTLFSLDDIKCEEEQQLKEVSKESMEVMDLMKELQSTFVEKLSKIRKDGRSDAFQEVAWMRMGPEGEDWGGGTRFQTKNSKVFDRASVNVSAVHYENRERCPVDSATALSVILHPKHPCAPSMHFHISYMEPRGDSKQAYWRMIADLNPSRSSPSSLAVFQNAIRYCSPEHLREGLYERAVEFGDRYFYIPALRRHRGASHFFIGKLKESQDIEHEDALKLASNLAEAAIEAYTRVVQDEIDSNPSLSVTDRVAQLSYHTMYTFQVLTLDRGTTHGLLAHSDNDVGTLGSLPMRADTNLLESWCEELKERNVPQYELLKSVVNTIRTHGNQTEMSGVYVVNDETRSQLANSVRTFYKSNRAAIRSQADLDLAQWETWMSELRS